MKKHMTIVGLILLLLLYGCGGSLQPLSKDEKKQLKNYKEWTKAIDVFENDEYVIDGFLDDGEIRVQMNQQTFDTSCIGLFPNLKYLVINVDTIEYESYDGTEPTVVDDCSELVNKIKAEYKDIDIYVLCEGKRLN